MFQCILASKERASVATDAREGLGKQLRDLI